MADDAIGEGARYWAFVSYSHKDASFGRRLLRDLERYSLPRRLVGRETAQGTVPRRLAPIFRDREEFAAASDLSTEVRAALKASRSLVVVCSPAAAASPWVTREVETFRALHPNRPVFAALAKGEPAEAFPEALRRAGGADIEPIAADFRKQGDGARAALLKLIAGIVGIGLDELVQRDAQRNLQRVTAVTVSSLIAMLVMGLLTIFAFNARSEAERQRGEAEGLVEFMLTDLRGNLVKVGRLDAMAAVNRAALHYYSEQDLTSLPADSLERRARVLLQMGEVDEKLGDNDAALAAFREAGRTTEALLAATPNDPQRIFDHSQTEYWIGSVDYQRGRYDAALPAFTTYKKMTDHLVAMEPGNPKYQMEAGYAEGDLCSVAVMKKAHSPETVRACLAALEHIQQAAARLPYSEDIQSTLVNRQAWLADAYFLEGDLIRSKAERLAGEAQLDRLLAADPKNNDLREIWVAYQLALSNIDQHLGLPVEARSRLLKAKAINDELIKMEPENKVWQRQHDFIESGLIGLTNH